MAINPVGGGSIISDQVVGNDFDNAPGAPGQQGGGNNGPNGAGL